MSLTSGTLPAGSHTRTASPSALLPTLYDGLLSLAFAWRPAATRTDESIALEALSLAGGARIVAPAAAGFPTYLTAAPQAVIGFDPRRAAIAAARLRITALQQLPSHDLAVRVLHTGGRGAHAAYERFIRLALDPETRRNVDGRTLLGAPRAAHVLRGGSVLRFAGVARVLAGLSSDAARLRAARSLEEQQRILRDVAEPILTRGWVRWILSRKFVLEALGLGAVERRALVQIGAGDVVAGLGARLARHVASRPIAEQPDLWRALGGRTSDAVLPPYLQPRHFAEARAHLGAAVLVRGTILDALSRERGASVDGFVLPGAIDVLTPQQLNALWFAVTRTAAPGASVVFRTAGQSSSLPGRLDGRLLARWRYDSGAVRALAPSDGVFRSGALHICRLRN